MSKKVALALGVTALAAPVGALSAISLRTFNHGYGARWSPAGNHIAFVALGPGTQALEVATIRTRVKKRLALSSARFDLDSDLAWSPGGSRIAFTLLDEPHVAAYRIYTVTATGGAGGS